MRTLIAICVFFALASGTPVPPLPRNGGHESSVSKQALRLTGEVIKSEKTSEDGSMVGFKVNLRLTINNDGDEAIIIYRNKPWLGAVDIAGSLSDAYLKKYLHRASAWPNAWGGSDRLELHKRLDQPNPPADITLVLKPGESWKYETVAWLGFDKKGTNGEAKKAWSEIKSYHPLFLQVTLEMWPVNVEPRLDTRNPEWGKQLRERWKNEGELWLDYLTSEPIELDLS